MVLLFQRCIVAPGDPRAVQMPCVCRGSRGLPGHGASCWTLSKVNPASLEVHLAGSTLSHF